MAAELETEILVEALKQVREAININQGKGGIQTEYLKRIKQD
jgi:hypothetical protein